MNYKDKILNIFAKGINAGNLFIPRMDIWYNANKFKGTLPQKYTNYSLRDITDDLEVGYHAFIPNFDEETEHVHFALGLFDFKTFPCKFKLNNIKVTYKYNGYDLYTNYKTPLGEINTTISFHNMYESGSTQPHTKKYPLENVEDIAPLIYIFENIDVAAHYDGLYEFSEYVGHRGIVCPLHSAGASPMHYILRSLCRMDNFYYLLYDNPTEMKSLSDSIEHIYCLCYEICLKSNSNVIMSGLNIDSSITPPSFYKEYILNSIRKRSLLAEKEDKFISIHTDGENKGLIEHYNSSNIHMLDSICPQPMTSLSMKEIDRKVDSKTIISGGIPSNILIKNTISDIEFKKEVDKIFVNTRSGTILSIADTTPPDADLKRLKYIRDKANELFP